MLEPVPFSFSRLWSSLRTRAALVWWPDRWATTKPCRSIPSKRGRRPCPGPCAGRTRRGSGGIADDSLASEDQDVGLGGPGTDPRGPQGLGLGLQQEGTAARQLAAEGGRRDVDQEALVADGRIGAVIQVIREGQTVSRSRMGRQDGVALADRVRPLDDQGLAGAVLLDDSGLLEDIHVSLAGAVTARALGGVDLDPAVVDPRAGQRGHDMLDHLDMRRPLLDRGPPLRWARHGRSGPEPRADPGGRTGRRRCRCRARRDGTGR